MVREEVGNYVITCNLLSCKSNDLILHHIRQIQYSHWKGGKVKRTQRIWIILSSYHLTQLIQAQPVLIEGQCC